ncbi:MAG: RNA polymerase sigma factor [Armatimonadetes bacterium]|nr:RNA polymerase sigma factor [Armatimonadota bacterium]
MSSVYENVHGSEFDDDLRLIDRFVAGDEDAFTVLYQRYYDRVFSIALGVLLRHDEASDAAQEIFTLVYRKLDKFDRRSRFSTWLYRIAVNRSIQHQRTMKYQKLTVQLDEAAERVESEPAAAMDPAVEQAMNSLPPDDRAMITLYYWDDLSLQEIAESMDCSPNAAKTRLFRARERFKKLYEEANR